MVAADDRTAVTFSLTPGQAHDATEGRNLLAHIEPEGKVAVVMDRAYEGNETRQWVRDLGFEPVVPPIRTRREPWEYDKVLYRRRNEVERLFRRLKGFRRIFCRYEKLDRHYVAFITLALIYELLRSVNRP